MEQRIQHESLAVEAFRGGRMREASFHAAKAAEYALILAEQSPGGALGRAYLTDANELMTFAERLREKAGIATVGEPVASGGREGGDVAVGEWQVTTRPDARLADVAGLEDVKKTLRDNVIWPRLHPEQYERYKVKPQAGVLMYGPPGNGKTYIAKAVAGELDAAFFNVSAATIKSKWVGKSEKNVKQLFEAAAKHDRAIIFIDECDTLLASGDNEKVNSFNQFLTEMDGIGTRSDAVFSRFILAATNKPWLLGDAVLRPGRLGLHVFVGLPDSAARERILSSSLSEAPMEASVDLGTLADQLEGYSGADVAWVADRAKRKALEREIVGGKLDRVTMSDLTVAAASTPRSVREEGLARYRAWRAEHSPTGPASG